MKGHLMWVLGLLFSCQDTIDSQRTPRLFDDELPFYQIAKTCTIKNQISESNPQPRGMTGSDDTPNLSNPKMTISLWGPPDRLTLSINKNDVWDRRWGWVKPVTLKEVKEGYFSPINKGNRGRKGFMTRFYPTPEGQWIDPYASWNVYPFPCPKPVGQIALLAEDFTGISQPEAVTQLSNGITEIDLQSKNANGHLKYQVMMDRNLIAVQGSFSELSKPLRLAISRHRDTYDPENSKTSLSGLYKDYNIDKDSAWNQRLDPPESGREGNIFWIRQQMPKEKTFPEGFEYMLVGLIDGEDYEIQTENNARDVLTPAISNNKLIKYPADPSGATAIVKFEDKPDHDFTVFATVVTTNDGHNLLQKAKQLLEDSKEIGMEGLEKLNESWYRDLYNKRERGRVYTGNSEDVKMLLPDLFYSWIYDHSLTSPDPERFEAQAKGYSFLETDSPPWHALPCYNELFMSTPLAVANRTDLLNYYVRLTDMWHETAQKNAREVYDLPGLYIGHGYIPPIKPGEYPHSHLIYEMSVDMPAQLIKYTWDVWEYGGDEEFLRDKVYPVMKDLATFYAAYLKKENDGLYHVEPTIPQERWVFNYRFEYNKDATTSIAMIRWTFEKAAEAAQVLNVDEELRKKWMTFTSKLPPYPIKETDEGPVWLPVEGDPLEEDEAISCLAKLSGLMAPVTLTNEINLDSDTESIQTAIRTGHFHDDVVWDRKFVFHLLGDAKRKFYRYVGTTDRWKLKDAIEKIKLNNQESGLDYLPLENDQDVVTACWIEPERLLNSRSGRIHLFPCVPDDFTIGFNQLLASGGFEVSAEMVEGSVTYLKIKARRNTACRLVNPWNGRTPKVIEEQSGNAMEVSFDPEIKQGFSFDARSGVSYLILKNSWIGSY